MTEQQRSIFWLSCPALSSLLGETQLSLQILSFLPLFYCTEEGKKAVSKTVSLDLFAETEAFITKKIHTRTDMG